MHKTSVIKMAVTCFVQFVLIFAPVLNSAPINITSFEAEIEARMRSKLEILNITEAMEELQHYRQHLEIIEDHGFRERGLADGLYSVIDPSSNHPGSRYIGKHLSTLLEVLQLGQVVYEVENSVFGGASCTACKAGLMFLSYYIHTGVTYETLLSDAHNMCYTLSMISRRMCIGLVESFGPEVYHVVKHLDQSPEEMCGFMFGEACNKPHSEKHEWEIFLPLIAKPEITSKEPADTNTRKLLKILHFSDTHWDPYYAEGSNALCDEPMCCRETSGPVLHLEDRAGYWGDYRKCDTPLRTIESMYRHINKEHKDIDYIYWTGDLPPHDIWNQTREGNLKVLRETSDQLRQYFPETTILPALGNHESAPVDSFPPPFVEGDHSISWLHNAMDTEWQKWLGPGPGVTLQYGGYYSVNIAPGLRVISLNMNYCMNKNFWLLLNSTDPAQELKWLMYELQLAEFKGEKVHLIGHIPPGHVDCTAVWSREFNKIVHRYESTVTAQFYGHTHLDEFQVFYERQADGHKRRATNIAYIGPSVTPYYGLNPSYRVYHVGKEDGLVIDHETWYMNLTEANLSPGEDPVWRKLYEARKDLQMPSLSPTNWDEYIQLIDGDNELFSQFYYYYHGASPERPHCDVICKKKIICNLQSSQSHMTKEFCNKIVKTWSYFNPLSWFSYLWS
eukprot:TRINITY_DN2753_c0_g1_i2.p1 TRINITY_DN2753_c0_g1~~TRINITY_DN2753_c0_g1_i2.p1  ORF type:complete len:675 (+),score=82.41 TRINITY_DN2753_c0_g1_i2:37-2061(+)